MPSFPRSPNRVINPWIVPRGQQRRDSDDDFEYHDAALQAGNPRRARVSMASPVSRGVAGRFRAESQRRPRAESCCNEALSRSEASPPCVNRSSAARSGRE
jgi:hypothetical protein